MRSALERRLEASGCSSTRLGRCQSSTGAEHEARTPELQALVPAPSLPGQDRASPPAASSARGPLRGWGLTRGPRTLHPLSCVGVKPPQALKEGQNDLGLSHSLPPGPWQRAPSPLRVTTPWPQSQPPVPKWAAPLAPSTSLLAAPTQPIQHRSLPRAQRGQMERRGGCSTFLPAAKAGPWGPGPPRSETNPSNSLNLRDGIWPPGGKGNLDRALQVSQPRPRGPGTPEPSVTPSPMTA